MRRLRSLRRRNKILLAAAAALILLLPAAGYGYFALQSTGAPAPASLGEAPEDLAANTDETSFAGEWTLAEGMGSFVGYRVRERLGFVPAPNDAVGRTNDVKSSLTIDGTTLTKAVVTADMRTLKSDAEPRDGLLHDQGLESELYPVGRFRLTQPVDLGGHAAGEAFSFIAPGKLTLHGITRPVKPRLQARWNGSSFQIAGQVEIKRADYKLEIEQQMGMRISENGKIELELTFVRPDAEEGAAAGKGTTTTTGEAPAATGKPGRLEPVAMGKERIVASIQRGPDDGSDLFTMALDGSGRKRLTKGFVNDDFAAAWSPDGSKIAFTRGYLQEGANPPHVFVVNADGSHARDLTRGSSLPCLQPAWSPDAERIAYISGTEEDAGIWVMNADGREKKQITDYGRTPIDSPVWSPDGTMIAYVAFVRGGNEEIFVIDADGTHRRNLTHSPTYDYAPAWAPDGKRIAFGRDGDIYVMNVEGTGVRRLTRTRDRDGAPKWSPDGDQIAFARTPNAGTFGGPGRIVVMTANGREQRRVPVRRASWPDWEPAA